MELHQQLEVAGAGGDVLRGQICLDPQLSARERDLVLMLAHGRTTAEIAALLQLRSDTVRRQLSVLYRRTGVTKQRGLIAWGLEHALLRPHDLVCQLR